MLTVIALLSLILGLHAHDCPNGYHHHGTSCYAVIPMKATWNTAQAYCNAINGTLAVVDTDAKRTYLYQYTDFKYGSQFNYYWIGGLNFIDGSWQWAPSLQSMNNIVWHPGDPTSRQDEHCIMMVHATQNTFSDFECYTKNAFVCETMMIGTNSV